MSSSWRRVVEQLTVEDPCDGPEVGNLKRLARKLARELVRARGGDAGELDEEVRALVEHQRGVSEAWERSAVAMREILEGVRRESKTYRSRAAIVAKAVDAYEALPIFGPDRGEACDGDGGHG